MPTPMTIQHLTLQPIPIESIPPSESAEHAALVAALLVEADLLLSSPLWSTPKSWSDGLVTTSALPHHATIHVLRPGQSDTENGKKAGSGFWGGGKKHERKVDDGIAWHMRRSVIKTLTYERVWAALAERHCEQEVEYVDTLGSIVTLSNDCFLKLYNLPFPTTNRSFLAHLALATTTPATTPDDPHPLRSFVMFSLPVSDSTPIKEEKGHVRGLYVALEEVREVRNESGEVELVWRCASQSTPGGSIPTKLAESYMPSSMASHVPSFIAWMATKSGDAHATERPAHSKHLSMDGVRRSLSLPKRKAPKGITVDNAIGSEVTRVA